MELTKKPAEQIVVELRGNSALTLDDRRLKADKIKFFYDDGSFYLEGAGSITKLPKAGATKITGKKILFNALRETELIIEH